MCSVTNTQFQHGEPLGDYERLDVNDLSVRNNLAIEGAGMSPGEVRQAWQDYLARDSSSDWARERQQP